MHHLEHLTILLAQSDDGTGVSWLETVQKGGAVGYLIIGMSIVALALIVMHFVQIRRAALIPPDQLEVLDDLLSTGDVKGSLEYCLAPENDSYLTRILAAGLTRFQKSAFGVFEVKSAIEEAGEDQTARLYRSTDALGVIGAIAPLLGLLGTVLGMVGAFDALPDSTASIHDELSRNISLALVTTLLGLTLAIPCVALFTFFRNRIDALGSEAGMEIERLTLHLESAVPGAAPSRPGDPRMRPAGPPTPAPPTREGKG
ncbi:MAG: MotA/TolQ/ExbB proton channel family protein [Planctomycetes bacterium]|nr:MotA/TolQ/ExbB proton channel family protein [Planctomycetota bacterium]